ncbi:MAG: YraN family protein [Parcubacteria group bacterium]|nr:YraN family protein [Parcubacteria group bacterium]
MAITEKRKIGDLGEDVATMFLMKQGFKVLERNYLRKWGEIDIIAKKDQKLYFVEVKTVSCGTPMGVAHETVIKTIFRDIFLTGARGYSIKDVSYETNSSRVPHETGFRPEDNLHTRKLQRLRRTIQTYLAEKRIGEESDWQFDAMCIYLDEAGKRAEVECIKDIIL